MSGVGRIRYRTYQFDSQLNSVATDNETGPFDELLDTFSRMQEGLGCYVTDAWDDAGNHVYDADDETYDRFAAFADDALDQL